MKKLITTYPGGFPLTLDRIRWMEDGINEAILAVCRSLLPPGATSMILEGCEVNKEPPGIFSISEGWIYLNQEGYQKICKVVPHTFNYSGPLPFPETGITPRWNSELEATMQSVTFFDGTTRHVECIDKAYIVVEDEGTLTPLASVPSRVGIWVLGEYLFFKLQNGVVYIKGGYFRYHQNEELLDQLPVAMRPDTEQRIPIQAYYRDAGENYTCALKIEAGTGIIAIIDPIHQGLPDVAYYISLAIPL